MALRVTFGSTATACFTVQAICPRMMIATNIDDRSGPYIYYRREVGCRVQVESPAREAHVTSLPPCPAARRDRTGAPHPRLCRDFRGGPTRESAAAVQCSARKLEEGGGILTIPGLQFSVSAVVLIAYLFMGDTICAF